MKKNRKNIFIALATVTCCIGVGVFSGSFIIKSNNVLKETNIKNEQMKVISTPRVEYIADLYQTQKKVIAKEIEPSLPEQKIEKVEEKKENIKKETKVEEPKEIVPERNEVYNNMTLEELSDKINKSLNSTIAGKGNLIASYSFSVGVDPYIATAIILHETGCKWKCSDLVTKCNNVGGQKGGPTCGTGSYKYYETLDDGIRGYLDNLNKNYFSMGLNTPELINPKYAANPAWYVKINDYIEDIKVK